VGFLGAIADDFTGASDLCSVLLRCGMRAVQTIGVARGAELPETDAVVVALKSRMAPVAEAVRESREALAWLRELGATQIYFKYCSTFDSRPQGNIGPVADALLDDLGAAMTVVCPAYPANGRTVYQGHLFVGDRLLAESPMAHHPLTPMTDSDLVRLLGRQTERPVSLIPLAVVQQGLDAIAAHLRELSGYAVMDAVDDGDLRAIGVACRSLPLVTGGAGLALGLAEPHGAEPAATPKGPAIVLAGSRSQATSEQVRRWSERYPAVEIGDAAKLPELPALVYAGGAVDPAQAARIEARLADVARRAVAAGARRVVVAGGETSAAVVQALGIRVLAVGREIAPGVPWMRSLGDPPLAVAMKSGNFGGPDFFLEAVA
jgi:uncharacterized protein YgbK (DUF1537 family)